MLIGKYNHTLDDKNRLIIPSKFRKDLGDTLILSLGYDHNVFIIRSKKEFLNYFQELNNLPNTKNASRQVLRHIFSSAIELNLDKQGRITLPTELLEQCKIIKEISIVGLGNHCEVWDAKILKNELLNSSSLISKISESIESKKATNFLSDTSVKK